MFCTSFPFHIKSNVHKNLSFFLKSHPLAQMPFQQVLFNLMLKQVVKPCPTWAVSLLVLFFYMTVRVNFFLKIYFWKEKVRARPYFTLLRNVSVPQKKWIINLVSRRKKPSKPIGKVRIISDLVFYNELNDT